MPRHRLTHTKLVKTAQPATVFIVEWTGCECGGASSVAFLTREAAERWIAEEEIEQNANLPRIVDYYEVKEVELR